MKKTWARLCGSAVFVGFAFCLAFAGGSFMGEAVAGPTDLLGPPFAISSLPTADTIQGTANIGTSAAAYNPVTKQFLVVWADNRNAGTTGLDIFGRLVNTDGSLGGEFPISTTPGDQMVPSVVYNSQTSKFLVVWTDARPGTGDAPTDIYGRLVNGNGTPDGSEFAIVTAPGYQRSQTVSYNSVTNQFLVAWEDNRFSAANVVGQRLNADGSPAGGEFIIAPSFSFSAQIAFNPAANQFLVVYFCNYSQCGRLINGDGTSASGEFGIAGESDAAVAFSPGSNRFLVVLWLNATRNIVGQLLGATGAPAGGQFTISGGPWLKRHPQVLFSPPSNEFLTIWMDARNFSSCETEGTNCQIFGQFVDPAGTLVGSNFAIATGARMSFAGLAHSPDADRFLVTWTDAQEGCCRIFGQIIGRVPPSLAPTVLWNVTFDGGGFDELRGGTVGPDGNPVVVGASDDLGSGIRGWRTIKYDGATGTPIWNVTWGTGGAFGVAVGGDGHPVVAGDGRTIKYHGATGAILWDAAFCCHPFGVAIGSDGHPVVVGLGTVVKYDGATGAVLWTQDIDAGVGGFRVAVGPDGNPVVASSLLTKFDGRTGATIWSIVPDGYAGAVAIGADGHPVTAGSSVPYTDFRVVKYNGANGNLLWSTTSQLGILGDAIAVGPDGNPVATGIFTENLDLPGNIPLAKYDGSTGAILWSVYTENGIADKDSGRGIGIMLDGNPFVAALACRFQPDWSCDFRSIRYGYLRTASDATTVSGQVNLNTVQVTFSSVTGGGLTTIFPSAPPDPGALPTGFVLLQPPIVFEVQTTAQVSGTIRVCAGYPDAPGAEETYRFFHNEGGTLVDRTASNDTAANVICADVPSLSSFLVAKFSYNFTGFFQPVDNLPTLNALKAGSAVPVKFSLGGNVGLDIFAAGYPKSQGIVCDSTALVQGIDETVTAGGSSLSFDTTTGQYVYVWKTDKTWASSCRQFVMKLRDGSTHRANFKFVK